MNATHTVLEHGIRDDAFEELLTAFERAESALEAYLAQPGDGEDPAVRRVWIGQLQQAVWNRYQATCEYLRARRQSLPEL
jgi:hypothetical protein